MVNENYYDFYFRDKDTKKRMQLLTDFDYVDQSFWDSSGIKMDSEYLYRVGQIPDTEIDCAVYGTGFYVESQHYNNPLVKEWANTIFKKYPPPPDEETRYLKLIENGESETIEFKSTFKYDIKNNKPNIECTHLISKTLCAFFNARGGTLFIGIEDNKNVIGLQYDLKFNFKNIDVFQQEVAKTIREDLGGSGIQFKLDIELIKEKQVCIISVSPSKNPVFYNNKEYFVRKGTQNQNLNPKETVEHINVRYGYIGQNNINRKQDMETKRLKVVIFEPLMLDTNKTYITIKAINKGVRSIVINGYGFQSVKYGSIIDIYSKKLVRRKLITPIPKKLSDGEACYAFYPREYIESDIKNFNWEYPLELIAYFKTNDGIFYSKSYNLIDLTKY